MLNTSEAGLTGNVQYNLGITEMYTDNTSLVFIKPQLLPDF
jgi:hypothetical protein